MGFFHLLLISIQVALISMFIKTSILVNILTKLPWHLHLLMESWEFIWDLSVAYSLLILWIKEALTFGLSKPCPLTKVQGNYINVETFLVGRTQSSLAVCKAKLPWPTPEWSQHSTEQKCMGTCKNSSLHLCQTCSYLLFEMQKVS